MSPAGRPRIDIIVCSVAECRPTFIGGSDATAINSENALMTLSVP
jgi:hypothetical protein